MLISRCIVLITVLHELFRSCTSLVQRQLPDIAHARKIQSVHPFGSPLSDGLGKAFRNSRGIYVPSSTRIRMGLSLSASVWLHQVGRTVIGTVISAKIARDGYKKGSLNRSGSIAAFAVAVSA